MTERFGYQYQLILGIPSKVNNFVIPQTLVSPLKVSQGTNGVSPDGIVLGTGDYLDYNTIPAKFWSVDDIQIKATINQSKEQGVPCSIELTNLDQDIVKELTKDALVILRAGYKQPSGRFIQTSVGVGQEQLPDIFVGQVLRVRNSSSDVDRFTSIDCGEAITVKKNSRVSKSFFPNTTREGVIRGLVDLLKTQGVPTGRITLPQSDTAEYDIITTPYLTGYSCQGMLMEELEKICEACSLRVFMAVGKLYIEPSSYTAKVSLPQIINTTKQLPPSVVVVEVTPDSIKGQVDLLDGSTSTKGSNENDNKSKVGLSFTVYLEGNITIDKVVRLKDFDADYNGEYKITSLTHEIDYRGDKWGTSLTVMQL